MQKPTIPQGTRDFGPTETARRRYIFETIERVFRLYGFKQIETPAMENLSTLMGKYGDEGDKLLFKILNSGDFLKKLPDEAKANVTAEELLPLIAEKGLRYDLTVPFARYVVMHQHELSFPFKRYQIQNVWRADRPQRGRYREFYQCDADIVGSDSLLYEAELIALYDEVFTRFGLPVSIKLNNRKLLEAAAIESGFGEHFRPFTVIIDKLDKIGREAVLEELAGLGPDKEAAELAMSKLFVCSPSEVWQRWQPSSEVGQKGMAELKEVMHHLSKHDLKQELLFDGTLARGLNYYTGSIFEVSAREVKMGSIGGGGRYDDLTGVFGVSGLSGVGISFGADRIYDVLIESNLFPFEVEEGSQILVCPMFDGALADAFELATACRHADIATEVYPTAAKLKKQLGYADKNKIKYAALLGEEELASGLITLKDLKNGNQEKLSKEALIAFIKNG